MTRKQVYLLIGMGLLMLLILGGVVAIYIMRDVDRKVADYQTELDGLKRQNDTEATNASILNHP